MLRSRRRNDDEILVSNSIATELLSQQLWQICGFWENTAFLVKVLLFLITEESGLF